MIAYMMNRVLCDKCHCELTSTDVLAGYCTQCKVLIATPLPLVEDDIAPLVEQIRQYLNR